MPVQRQTAHKCRISDLLNGNYVIKQGWEPNYVETAYGNISRANIIAVVVSKDSPKSIMLDDGSGRLLVRYFDNDAEISAEVGDAVQIIGRPRAYNNEMFIVPEIIKRIENQKWIELRKLELDARKKTKEIVKKTEEVPAAKPSEVKDAEPSYYDILVKKIRENDQGNGAKVEDLLKELDKDKAEKTLKNLFEEGEIFEIRPGFIKVLE